MEPTAQRLRRTILAARREADGWRAFASTCAQSVARAVGADGWCLASADPASLLMTGVVADHGEPSPRFFELEYAVSDYLDQSSLARGTEHVGSLDRVTGGRLNLSPRWRELIEPWGFGDQLRAALVSGRGCWGYLGLVRGRGASSFSLEEESLVAAVGDVIADGIRFAFLADQARTRIAESSPGLVLLDAASIVIEATAPALDLLGDIVVGGLPPEAVAAVAARARGRDGMAVSHVRVQGVWLTLHATSLAAREDRAERAAVVIEPARPLTLLELFTTAAGLTARETEVARAVVRGSSTSEIARALLISPLTVQQHLKSIFDKIGVRSRRELVGLVFERHYMPMVLGGPPDPS